MRFVFEDFTGCKFGRWTVIRFGHKNKYNQSFWRCRCECGNEKDVNRWVLTDGRSKSCGCWQAEWSSKRHRKHGDSRAKEGRPKPRLYDIWASMIKRCYNANCTGYKNYGGRGIKVCDRWHDYANFKQDVSAGYRDDLTIDRFPNNDGNYEPGNIRWATQKQQMRNVRYNRIVQFQGEQLPLAEWCERLRVPYKRARDRLDWGWSPERAFLEPPQHAGPFGRVAKAEQLLAK